MAQGPKAKQLMMLRQQRVMRGSGEKQRLAVVKAKPQLRELQTVVKSIERPPLAVVASSESSGLELYDAMCMAIEKAHAVDELVDIHDSTKLFEAASRLAKNKVNERRAKEIRVRAAAKAGKLLSRMEKARGARGVGRAKKGGRPRIPPKGSMTLAEHGLSKKQSSQWQKLGRVPQEETRP
jgi:hypothetical protein